MFDQMNNDEEKRRQYLISKHVYDTLVEDIGNKCAIVYESFEEPFVWNPDNREKWLKRWCYRRKNIMRWVDNRAVYRHKNYGAPTV